MKPEPCPLRLSLQKIVIAELCRDETPVAQNDNDNKNGHTTGSCFGCETIERTLCETTIIFGD